jgi:hypothetical protein
MAEIWVRFFDRWGGRMTGFDSSSIKFEWDFDAMQWAVEEPVKHFWNVIGWSRDSVKDLVDTGMAVQLRETLISTVDPDSEETSFLHTHCPLILWDVKKGFPVPHGCGRIYEPAGGWAYEGTLQWRTNKAFPATGPVIKVGSRSLL